MSSTTRPSRNGERDAYYTPDAVARACIRVTEIPAGAMVLEPSVGGGAFVRALAGQYTSATYTPPDAPMGTATGWNKQALVAAFLLKYYQQGGQWSACGAPMDTVAAKARMGLVTVTIQGEEYVLADIGMRMLQPRELARAQGFDDSYILTGTKSQQVARIGNSVCPPVARAVAGALVG